MSVRPNTLPPAPCLCGTEGELLSIRISVEPRLLEDLLDSLANLDFPINPQIYHNAAAVFVYPDGRNTVEPATTVEFPAYSGRLPQVRKALEALPRASLLAKSMLEDLHSDYDVEAPPAGAPYVRVIRYKQVPERQKAAFTA